MRINFRLFMLHGGLIFCVFLSDRGRDGELGKGNSVTPILGGVQPGPEDLIIASGGRALSVLIRVY